MRGAERSAGNTAKNIALIVLAVLMAVLCAANWLAGVSAASLGSDNPLRRVHDRLFGGAAGYEIPLVGRVGGFAGAACTRRFGRARRRAVRYDRC